MKIVIHVINLKQTKSQRNTGNKNNKGNAIVDHLKPSNEFNDYFVSIRRKLASKIHQPTSSQNTSANNNTNVTA